MLFTYTATSNGVIAFTTKVGTTAAAAVSLLPLLDM